jgi:cytochrome c-type biogenesis protein CcmH/NrfG
MVYQENKEYVKAAAALKKSFLSAKYSHDADGYARLGTIYLLGKDYDNAKTAFEDALKIDPDNSGALHNLGIIYLNRNDLVNAELVFRKVYALNSENPGVIFMLAQVLERTEKTIPEAITLYSKALSLAPNNVQGYVNLGNLCLKTGDRQRALLAYEKALELSPGSRELRAQVDALKNQR